MLSSTPRGRGECRLRGECRRQGKKGKVHVKERSAATVAQEELTYCSVRGVWLPQFERSTATAMQEEVVIKVVKVVIKERIAATVAQGERIYRSVRGAQLPQCERSVSTAMREERGNVHAKGVGPQPCKRRMLSSMPRGRGECRLRGECGRQGKTGKVHIKERSAATVAQEELSYCSVRGVGLL